MIRIIILIFAVMYCTALLAGQNHLPVVPQPQHVKFLDNKLEIKNQRISVTFYCPVDEPLQIIMQDVKHTVLKFADSQIIEGGDSGLRLLLGLKGDKAFDSILKQNALVVNDSLGDEGYSMRVDPDKIIIAALNQKGLFYGLQTLKQMFRGCINDDFLPGVVIYDKPAFKYRAIMDDISRGPLPTMDYMKYQVRRLAEMKINTIIHYVEHVVKTKSHPGFAPDDGSLTIEEWREIADYAWQYNITVIGGFQSFGHFQKILETPEYAHLGESGSLISPVLPESYEFLEDIYKEMIPAFHSDLFNVNCDETFDLGKEASKSQVDSLGYAEVYFQHMMKLYNIVKKHDKRMVMWGDILMQHPELLDKLPQDVLIGTWNYDDKESFDSFIDPFRKSPHEFWVVPGILNSYSIFPDFNKAFKNIKTFVSEGYAAGASGVLTCFWDDGGTALFSNDWYGAAYGADKSWNPASADMSFDARYAIGSFATENTYLMQAIRKLNELRLLELTDGMTDKFMFARLLPQQGKEFKISLADLERARHILDEAQVFVDKANLKLYSDDLLYLQFIIDLYKTLVQERYYLIEAAEHYSGAQNAIANDRSSARKQIVRAVEFINRIITNEKDIKAQYEVLWLKENHIYALNWITDKYVEKINNFISVRELLFESLHKLDSEQAILSKEDVRLAITKLPGKYFTEWMMPNPINNKDKSQLSGPDYLKNMGGEKTANPKVTQEFYFDNEKYRWRRVVSEYPDIVNLAEIFPDENINKVIYAFANISCSRDTIVKAAIGCDEGIEVFINGKKVFRKTASGEMRVDAFEFELPLQQGKNNLLIKSSQTDGEWAFTFRLPEESVRSRKNRYKIID